MLSTLLGPAGTSVTDSPQLTKSRVEAALENISVLERPKQDGFATVWDGNKYVQCRRMPDHALRCEAAGALMQPSLGHVLVPAKLGRLAGVVNDAPSMAATAIHSCVFTPASDLQSQTPRSAADLINTYGARVTGEIQRLRINIDRRVFVILDTEMGYLQCESETSPATICCEAVSADSWPVLANVLTPERLTRLHAAGFVDPGRGPNYWKNYPIDTFDDTTIAHELLTILHDVYSYGGAPKLAVKTEKGG